MSNTERSLIELRRTALASLVFLALARSAAASSATETVEAQSPLWTQVLIYWLPFLVLVGLWVFFLRQMKKPRDRAEQKDRIEQKLDRILELLERKGPGW